VVAAERRLPFEGVTNFRDLGGYLTPSGGRTRWGQVFRSDALHQLTAADLVAFERLGLRVVYDLRSDDERQREPNPMESLQLALLGRLPTQAGQDWKALQHEADGERWLYEQYAAMLATAGPLLGQLLSGLTDIDGLPAVFHCAGGKDRTGLAAALLLSWLGVDREVVLDDYELTSRWRTVETDRAILDHLVSQGCSTEAAAASLGAPRWVMAQVLDVLDNEYGGIETYLLGPAGMDQGALLALQRLLIR
jgi:protein-tyrosine phosphatase